MKILELGYTRVIVPKEQRHLAFNAILINELHFKKSRNLDSGSLEITIKSSMKERFKSVFEDNCIEAEFKKSNGIGACLTRYRNRWGILIGVFVLMTSIYLSSLFVWRIDISGNENISDNEVLEILEKSGCSLGTFIPAIDYDSVHNKFLLESENISWISVNIKGNVANVLVRERMKEEEKNKGSYTNVVSKYDAQIAIVQLYNGKKVVSVGDVVKKGDLLISGIIDSQSQGVRYIRADGIVKGYVNKSISVKIPLKSVEKRYTDKIYKNKTLKIFSKSINFSLKYRNYDEFYDKIETRNKIRLFGVIELPIELITTYYREYEYVEVTYTPEQAVDIAFSKLRSELDVALENAELISKTIKTDYDENGAYIDCNVYCIEDISQLVEFEAK